MKQAPEKLAFTKTRLDALAAPSRGRRFVYDVKVPGLALAVTAAGTRTFYLYRWLSGGPQRVRIGRYPDVSIEQARREAARLNGLMVQGVNPQAVRRAVRREATLGDLVTDYLERAQGRLRPRSLEEYTHLQRRYLGPLALRRLSTIDRAAVERLHAGVGRVHGHYAANRMLALVSAAFNHCAAGAANPAHGVKRFKEHSRDRFLDAGELRRFFVALEAEPSAAWRDFFAATLLTGARRANVLAMRWNDLDLDRGLWRIPAADAKGGEALTMILAAPVVGLLRRRAADRNGNLYVFPGVGASGHLHSPKTAWHGLLKRAGLVDAEGKNTVRIHDLRRTLGSWQAAAGASLSIIGKTLGHKNVATTAIYARLDLESVRASVNTAAAAIMDAAHDRKALPAPQVGPARKKGEVR